MEKGAEKPRQHLRSETTASTVQLPKRMDTHASHAGSALSRQTSEALEHEGQIRAKLNVKEGGFALGNFGRKNPGRVEDFYRFETKKLGEGGFGTVRRGQDKNTDRWCAVKCVKKKGGKDDVRLQEEIEIMRLLDHPHIVRLIESFEDHKYTHMVLELCEGGELLEQIIQAKCFTEATAAQYIQQMLLAVNYLHQNHIMHRDLKPENWLLATKEGLGRAPLKLIDFGISRRFKPGQPARTKAGTPNYVAPEVLGGKYDEKSDIWSMGVITYVLLTGTHPFAGKTTKDVLKRVREANVSFEGGNWKKISDAAKSFVATSMSKAPSQRHSALKALEHRWLSAPPGENQDTLTSLELSGLKAFGRMHQLKRAACTVIATQLTDERIEALKSMFMSMDHNRDGSLSVVELKAGFEMAGVSCPGNLDRLLQEADTDGSGVIDYTEFLAATMDKKLYHQENTVWTAFKKFDLDGDGIICRNELAMVMRDDTVKQAMHVEEQETRKYEEVFLSVDTNNDGQIDFDEFFAMMCKAEGGKLTSTGLQRVSPKKRMAPAGLALSCTPPNSSHSAGAKVGIAAVESTLSLLSNNRSCVEDCPEGRASSKERAGTG